MITPVTVGAEQGIEQTNVTTQRRGTVMAPIEATGRLGASALFDGHTVRLTRTMRGMPGRGEREIPIGQLAAVEWKPAGMVTDGFIRFVVAGVVAPRLRFGQQSNQARLDEWAVPFWRKQQPQFEVLRDALRAAIVRRY